MTDCLVVAILFQEKIIITKLTIGLGEYTQNGGQGLSELCIFPIEVH